MMFPYPYFPWARRFPYHRYSPYYSNYYSKASSFRPSNNSSSQQTKKKETSSSCSFVQQCEQEQPEENDLTFDLFGLHLHFDDILLICLLIFLYHEGVKDQNLFMALILLLLS